jgi:hypothetical protein
MKLVDDLTGVYDIPIKLTFCEISAKECIKRGTITEKAFLTRISVYRLSDLIENKGIRNWIWKVKSDYRRSRKEHLSKI